MFLVVGPVLTRKGGYAVDSWTLEDGVSRGYVYRRIEDAYYARKVEIRCSREGYAGHVVTCNTVAEFVRATTVTVHPPETIAKSERRLPLRGDGGVEPTARLGSRKKLSRGGHGAV
jgi:hypothetical protein